MRTRLPLSVATTVALLLTLCLTGLADDLTPPENVPAQIEWNGARGQLRMKYHGADVFTGTLRIATADGEREPKAEEVLLLPEVTRGERDAVEQRLILKPGSPREGTELVLRGTATGSEEGFPAETMSAAQQRFPCVRNSIGLSRSLRNNAVYDRQWDWVLIGPGDGKTRIAPKSQTPLATTFAWESRGPDLVLTFRPFYYQKHRNLRYFQPWTYKVRKDSITGWCSWWAYQKDFSQADLEKIVNVMAKNRLADFGYRFIQIDDTYQGGSGTPESWLKWNDKFPGGMEKYVETARAGGFEPGIWIASFFNDEEVARKHPDWFVREPDGTPRRGPWVNFGIDATVPEAADALLRPTYRGVKQAGFTYVKIDSLRHLLYDSLHSAPNYAPGKGLTSGDIFRRYLAVARNELGPDVFVLSCWGVLPEAIGLVDGCRLGGDGYGPATLQQYNSFNGVVWRNDPDHCDILPRKNSGANGNDAKTAYSTSCPANAVIRPCLASMAGAMLMISDRAEVYQHEVNLEGVKRSAPILFTVPGQLYDFDPRKSDNLKLNREEVTSGSGQSPIDADQFGKVCPWWILDLSLPFENWTVLGHFNWEQTPMPESTIKLADLGLSGDREYLVYEFWTCRFLGAVKGSFLAPALEPNGLHVFAIREKRDRPQILSTNRHISQGGSDLQAVEWRPESQTLRGRSQVVRNDRYELLLYVPSGYAVVKATKNDEPVNAVSEGSLVRVAFTPKATGTVNWSIEFTRRREPR